MSTPVKVELFYDSVWNDITSDVYTRDDITITRGRSSELERVSPSTLDLSIKNTSHKYSPRNPESELYGKIGRNTPIRVSVTSPSAYRFHGEVESWPQRWTVEANDAGTRGDVWAPIKAYGPMRRLGGAGTKAPSKSAMRRYIDALNPVAYWPMDTPVNLTGGAAMVVTATDSGGAVVQDWSTTSVAPWLEPGAELSDLLIIAPTAAIVETALATIDMVAHAKPTVASAGSWGLNVADSADNTVALIFASWVNGVPTLQLFGGGGPAIATASASNAAKAWDNTPHHWRIVLDQNGADIAITVYLDGVSIMSGTDTSATLSTVKPWVFTNSGVSGAASHVVQWSGTPPSVTDAATAALGNVGEQAHERIRRICDEENIAFTMSVKDTAATDTFSRTVSGSWGTSDSGHVWTTSGTGGAGTPSVSSGTGRHVVNTSGNFQISWLGALSTLQASDITATFDLTFSNVTGGDIEPSLVLRLQDVNNYYMFRATINSSEAITLSIRRLFSGETTLATASIGHVWDGNPIRLRAQAIGSTLRFRVWSASGVEPASWQVTATDTTFATGRPGIRSGVGGGNTNVPVTFHWDDVTVIHSESAALGPQPIGSTLDVLQDSADADGGILYESSDVFGLEYVTHNGLLNQDAAITLDYTAGGEVAPPMDPTEDTDHVQNDVTVTRRNGGSSTVVQETGPLNVQEPVDDPQGVGRYPVSVTLTLESDSQTQPQAAWIRHLGTWDEPRYPSIVMDLTAMDADGKDALVTNAIAVDIGDRLVVQNPPKWQGPSDVDQHIQGYTETLGSHRWWIEPNTTPAGPWQVGVLDTDRLYGSTTISEDLTTTETDITVPSGVFSTTSEPYDVIVGGEVMTVTSATSTVLTVTRSVNGVVKTHTTGDTIEIYQPLRLARGA